MRNTRDRRPAGGGQDGWAELAVLAVFAAIIGFAFMWALLIHEKPPDDADQAGSSSTTSTVPGTPATLPPPRKYEVEGGVNVRQGPGTNTSMLTKVEDGKKVLVECKAEGQAVTSSDGSTTLWLRINLGEFGAGYVSALYVDTGDDIEDANRIAPCI